MCPVLASCMRHIPVTRQNTGPSRGGTVSPHRGPSLAPGLFAPLVVVTDALNTRAHLSV